MENSVIEDKEKITKRTYGFGWKRLSRRRHAGQAESAQVAHQRRVVGTE